jgi:predicted nucleic acid-binding protein
VITLDSSGLFALLDHRNAEHAIAMNTLESERGPHIVPVPILAEIAYMVETRLHTRVLDAFLGDLDSGAFVLDCCTDDVPDVQRLVRRYADLPLGFADACVIACAERNGGRVLSLDKRDFGVVAREGRITLLPA